MTFRTINNRIRVSSANNQDDDDDDVGQKGWQGNFFFSLKSLKYCARRLVFIYSC